MTIEILFITIAIIAAILSIFRNKFLKNGEGLILNLIQNFVGLLFIFSGFVKAVDPRGTGFKMKDYFESFAQDGLRSLWEKMAHYDVLFSISMIVFEIALGIAILVGWRPRWTTIGLLGINIFFLYLTGYSYLSGYCLSNSILVVSAVLLTALFLSSFLQNHLKRFQGLLIASILVLLYFIYVKMTGNGIGCEFTESKMKVTDCGCFGDFLKLKPMQTFYKDIVLTFLSVVLVRYHHRLKSVFDLKWSNLIVYIGTGIALLFSLYNTYWNEPPIDFRPYCIGCNINEKMKEIKPQKAEFIFVYKNTKTSEQKEFGMNNIPTDTTWTYVDRKDKILEEGIPAPIHNLRFEDKDGNEVTMSLLTEQAASYWVVCYNLDKADLKSIDEKIIPFATEMRKKGINIYFLTRKGMPANLESKVGPIMDIVYADETPLKTMIRSNPGIMKIQNGTVLNKWHIKQFSTAKAQ